jgi:uncharacterized SAM-dependent methyltransferase
MQMCLTRRAHFEPHSYVQVGHRVRVKGGRLESLEGIVFRKRNHLRFVISLRYNSWSCRAELDAAELERVR